jgi:hypothetical protein
MQRRAGPVPPPPEPSEPSIDYHGQDHRTDLPGVGHELYHRDRASPPEPAMPRLTAQEMAMLRRGQQARQRGAMLSDDESAVYAELLLERLRRYRESAGQY